MSKSEKKPSTTSLSEEKIPVVRVVKTEQKEDTTKTTIFNDSATNIFLIPISCTEDESPRSEGTIVKRKVKMIGMNETITVRSGEYNLNDSGSSSQIHIIFRAGDAKSKDEFVEKLGKNLAGVKLGGEEKFLLHSQLYNKIVRLKCLEGPVRGDGSADRVSEEDKKGETNKQSNQCPELNSPSAELHALKKEVEALQKDMESLKSHLKSFVKGLTKHCESLQAYLDPSLSINTHSSSK